MTPLLPYLHHRHPEYFYPGCPFGDALNTLSAPFGHNEPSVVVQAFDEHTAELAKAGLKASTGANDVAFRVHGLNSSLVRTWQNQTELVNVTKPDAFRPMVRWSVSDPTVPLTDVDAYTELVWPVLLLRKSANEPEKLIEVNGGVMFVCGLVVVCVRGRSPTHSLVQHASPLSSRAVTVRTRTLCTVPSSRRSSSPSWTG